MIGNKSKVVGQSNDYCQILASEKMKRKIESKIMRETKKKMKKREYLSLREKN